MSLTKNLEVMKKRMDVALLAYIKTNAAKLEAYMKSNAKWQDRTGQARQSLNGSGYKEEDNYVIKLAHGSNVNYGVFLELAHRKKYAIIRPTIQLKSPEVMQGFSGLLDKLEGDINSYL